MGGEGERGRRTRRGGCGRGIKREGKSIRERMVGSQGAGGE